jgi:hypothetical protein
VNFSRTALRMTNEEFRHCQDKELEISGKNLAEALGVTPSSISHWREDREVPLYIVRLLDFLVAKKKGRLVLPLPFEQLIGLSRAAARRGITVEMLLLEIIRGVVDEPAPASSTIPFPQNPPDHRNVADESTPPPVTTNTKMVSYKSTLNKPATED